MAVLPLFRRISLHRFAQESRQVSRASRELAKPLLMSVAHGGGAVLLAYTLLFSASELDSRPQTAEHFWIL